MTDDLCQPLTAFQTALETQVRRKKGFSEYHDVDLCLDHF